MSSPTASVLLRAGRDRALRARHPWLLSGSVAEVEGSPAPGDVVRVASESGETLGYGDYDPASQIRVRIHHFGEEPDPEEGWVEERIEAALLWRERHPSLGGTDALRWVHSEADRLPGLTIDRYADWVSVKPATPAMLRRVPRIAEWLETERGVAGTWLRGEPRAGGGSQGRLLAGSVPEEPIAIEERGRRYFVDLRRGQKTGFYLDQREARDLFASLARGAAALDLYAYSGGFSVAAVAGDARTVVAVETSKAARDLLERNAPSVERVGEDTQAFLARDERRYDLIAVDPPPFAKRKRDAVQACRAYQELNRRVLLHASPGAHVLTFSCSHHVDAEMFRSVVFRAADQARVEVQVLRALGAPPDHAVSLTHPQGEYLKGLLLRVVDTVP